jgi:GDP-4-dehydro-6-deoxy-D-mannose reductase
MRALVTGGSGFVGQWLCRALLSSGWDVAGTMLGDVVEPGALGLDERRAIRWIRADLRRQEEVGAAIDAASPDAVFHLAGIAFVPAAAADPGGALDVNVGAAARLLAVIRERRRAGTLDPLVLVVGSGEQYGRHEAAELPLPETAEQRPISVYAASKAAQEIVALEAWRSDGVRVVVTRSFNHSGPGQQERFLLPALVRRALALRGKWRAELKVGNTTPVRDYLHVADVADAYERLAHAGEDAGRVGEAYNVASGVGFDVEAVATRVLALANVEARLQVDPELVRPVDLPALIGDARKLRRDTGWAPERDLDAIIEDLIRAAAD